MSRIYTPCRQPSAPPADLALDNLDARMAVICRANIRDLRANLRDLRASVFYDVALEDEDGGIVDGPFRVSNTDTFVFKGPSSLLTGLHKSGNTTTLALALSPTVVNPALTIYANAATGSDSNDGLTSGSAVLTIQRALGIFAERSDLIVEGTVQLEGGAAFVLATELDLFPAVSRVGSLIFQGTPLVPISGTVTSLTTGIVGPSGSWIRVTDAAATLGANDYMSSFIRNDTQGRDYVVLSNGISTIDVIVGNGAPGGLPDPWSVGDDYTLFKVQNTIEFSGELTIVNTWNADVAFRHIWVKPTATGSAWNNTKNLNTTFSGCRLDTFSLRSYTGSMNTRGCYSESAAMAGIETTFSPSEQGACKNFFSVWLDGAGTAFNDTCSAIFVNSTDCASPAATFAVESSEIQLFSVQMTGMTSHYGIDIAGGSSFDINFINITNTPAIIFPINNVQCTGSKGTISNAIFTNVATQTNSMCLNAVFAADIFLAGTVIFISTGVCLNSVGGSEVTIFASVNMQSSSMSRHLISFDNASRLSIRLSSGHIHSYTGPLPIFGFNSNSSLAIMNSSGVGGSGGSITCTSTAGGTVAIFTGQSDGNISTTSGTTTFCNMSAGLNPAIFSVATGSALIFSRTGSGTVILKNNTSATGRGVVCSVNAIYTQIGTAIVYDTTQTAVLLTVGSSCAISPSLTGIGPGNLLICGNQPPIPGPGTYSISINDSALVPTQNCSASFG